MKKIISISTIILILGIVYYFYKNKNNEEEKKYENTKVEVSVFKEFIETTGQVEPLNRVEILPPSSGRIEKIFVEEGNLVKAGDVLALMSSQDRVAILDSARAISEKEYKYWQDSYKPIKVIAPISGRIILRNIVEGETVTAGTVLFAMSDTLIVVASVDEADIGKVKVGQKVFINLDAYQDVEVKGRVFQILDEGKNSNSVIIYKVKIKMDKIPNFFKSQMTANIKILINSGREVLSIADVALNYSKDGIPFVIIGFDKNKKPIEKNIEIGNEYQNKTEIKKGLKEGEEVYYEVKAYKSQKKAENIDSPFMPKKPKIQDRKTIRQIR